MRSKNGFTLIELTIMIGLIVLIALMFTNNMDGIIGSQTQKSYDRFVNKIKVASEAYISAKPNYINEILYGRGYTKVSIQNLIENGFLDKNIIDPRNDTPVNRNEEALIKLTCDGKLHYVFPITVAESNVTYVESIPLIVDVAPANLYQDLNTIGLRMINETGNVTSLVQKASVSVPGDINVVEVTFTNNNPGVYHIKYNYVDNIGICRPHIRQVTIY